MRLMRDHTSGWRYGDYRSYFWGEGCLAFGFMFFFMVFYGFSFQVYRDGNILGGGVEEDYGS